MVGQLIAGRYELTELAGSGGMSSVFKAYDRVLERTVAIKILHEHYTEDPDYVERFRHEARAVAQLSHPNIVTVIDRGEQDGRQYIVFEYVEGENLKEVVRRTGRLPAREALELCLQVARGLAFAHENGIVHRDVKPQNVLLTEEGRAKVTDFGIARSLDVQGVTQTGTVLGTSDYIAPEQARGERVDHRTDVYSLGVVLYELLTGEVPYRGDNFVVVAMRHVNDPVPSVLERRRDLPIQLELAVRRAMAKHPGERFASMDDLADELETCILELGAEPEGERTLVVPARVLRRRRRQVGRRRTLPVLLAGVALVALLAAGTIALLDSTGAGPGAGDDGAAAAQPVKLTGVASYDPPPGGDGREHGEAVARATDGDPATYWTTETYSSFRKEGVGLVLDAGRPVALSRLTVTTDTPGFPARIQASDRPDGGFVDVSEEQTVSGTTTFELDTKDEEYRYYLIWLRLPEGGVARVNEAKAA